jgi:hypothetical protein
VDCVEVCERATLQVKRLLIDARLISALCPRMWACSLSYNMVSPKGRSSVAEQRPFKPLVVGSTPTAPTILNYHCFRCLRGSTVPEEKWRLHQYSANCAGFVQVSFLASRYNAHNAGIFSVTLDSFLDFRESFTNVVLRDDSIALIYARGLMS